MADKDKLVNVADLKASMKALQMKEAMPND